jgi:deoxyribonuclease-4
MHLGCHLSTTKGFLAMGREALRLGADTFQFFTRNPRGGAVKAIDPQDLQALVELMDSRRFGPLVAHAPYTLNPCAEAAKTLDFARLAMTEDLQRLEGLPRVYYNFHPGSHTGQGLATGLAKTAALLDEVLRPGQSTMVLLETMAGKGTELGRAFGELADILGRVKLDGLVGVCLDTCHVFDGGYDVRNDLDGVLAQFDRQVGLGRLKAVHVNDSLNVLGSRKDRHAKIGHGRIGLEALRRVVRHPLLEGRPFILETPNDLEGYAAEIKLLREEL